MIKLFRIHLKALVKIVYYILKERKKEGRPFIEIHEAANNVSSLLSPLLVRLFHMFAFGYLPSLIL